MSDRAVTGINLTLIAAWTALALATLPANGHFLFDEAYFYEQSVRVAESFHLPAFGPPITGGDPRAMIPGGLLYVVYAVPFFFSRAPEAAAVWLILLGALGAVLFDRALRTLNVAPAFRLFAVTLEVWSLWHARYADRIWNPDLFYLTTPALLLVTARLAEKRGHRLVHFAALAAVAAVGAQAHFSALLPLALCLGYLFLRERRLFDPRAAAAFAAGLLVCYLPWLVVEAPRGFVDLRALVKAGPSGQFAWRAALSSLNATWLYPSHAGEPSDLWQSFGWGWPRLCLAVSGWVSIALSALGAWAKSPLRAPGLMLAALLPIFFLVTGRDFHDHYVASIAPLAVLLPAGAAAWVWQRFRRGPAIAAVLVFHVCSGALLMRSEWSAPSEKLDLQRERAQAAIHAPPASVGEHDQDPFTLWVLARRVYGTDLRFDLDGQRCGIEVVDPSQMAGRRVLAYNVVWACSPSP